MANCLTANPTSKTKAKTIRSPRRATKVDQVVKVPTTAKAMLKVQVRNPTTETRRKILSPALPKEISPRTTRRVQKALTASLMNQKIQIPLAKQVGPKAA